ncbi:WD40 repeat domain-containing protein [Maioricimonas sp. JC845]|uniref:WD40 repeat domain-containing protein n=1 Tax=Maioricimonas sp. JC845 TaxID=3232138 RepID=UPI00345A45CD
MRQTAGLLAVAGFVLLLVTKGLDRLEQLQIPLPRRHALAHFQPQSLARNPFSSCRPAAILRGHTSPIAAVAFLDSGQTLLSAGRDGNLRFWDIRSGTCHRTMPTVSGKLLAFSLSPDKRLLATAHDDSLVRVWNLNKQQLEFVLQGHEGPVSCITFSSDQQQLASGGKDGTIRLWNLEKQGCRHVLPGSHAAISCVAFAPDDATIAGGDERGTVCTWSAGSGHQLRTLNRQGSPAAATAVAFSPSNSGLLACTYTDSRLRVWDTSSGDLVLTGERNSVRLTAVAFRPDSRIAATGSKDHSVGIWDLDQRCLVGHLPGPEPTSGDWLGRVTCLAFDDSGGLLAVGHIDSVIRMWDLRTALRPKQRLPARKASGGPAGTANAGPGDRRSKHKASGSPHRN